MRFADAIHNENNKTDKEVWEIILSWNTLDFFYKELRILSWIELLNSETEIGTGVA